MWVSVDNEILIYFIMERLVLNSSLNGTGTNDLKKILKNNPTKQNSMSEGNKDTNDTGTNIWWFVIINLWFMINSFLECSVAQCAGLAQKRWESYR